MLQPVDVETQPLEDYREVVPDKDVEALKALGDELRGARVVHINATPYGGGVSELLRSVVPIYREVGIAAEWQVITGNERFFRATKDLHNALQGAATPPSPEAWEVYMGNNADHARQLEDEYDFVVVHDPQPMLMAHFHERDRARWIWRCHIDTSDPDKETLGVLTPFIGDYEVLVFTMPEFVPPSWGERPSVAIPPAIDPINPKNMDIPIKVCDHVARWLGVDPGRPILTQVSRFDPWKDPLGVVGVYRQVREEVPGLQLALLGSMALDDPEGWELYERIREEVDGDRDIHVATNITGVSNVEVNAFQRRSDVVIQKSIREGFGLVVSETLWKGTPVVAGKAGGIPVQMPEGVGGFLVEDPGQYASRVGELLRDRELARDLGERGRAHVRERFLVTRLVADELRLLASLSRGETPAPLEPGGDGEASTDPASG